MGPADGHGHQVQLRPIRRENGTPSTVSWAEALMAVLKDYLRRVLTKRYNAELDIYEDVALYDNVYVPKIASKRKVKKFQEAAAAEL